MRRVSRKRSRSHPLRCPMTAEAWRCRKAFMASSRLRCSVSPNTQATQAGDAFHLTPLVVAKAKRGHAEWLRGSIFLFRRRDLGARLQPVGELGGSERLPGGFALEVEDHRPADAGQE